jgi:hypothetical protein
MIHMSTGAHGANSIVLKRDRKEVFDEFITKTEFISSIVEARFSLIKQVYHEYQSIKVKSTFWVLGK